MPIRPPVGGSFGVLILTQLPGGYPTSDVKAPALPRRPRPCVLFIPSNRSLLEGSIGHVEIPGDIAGAQCWLEEGSPSPPPCWVSRSNFSRDPGALQGPLL